MYFSKTAVALAAVLPLATAQTYTDCDPLNSMFLLFIPIFVQS